MVGAVLGIGGTKSTTTITFIQNQFYPGEQLRILLESDNSKCKTSIKNFKFKCFRIITQKDAITGEKKTSEQKVFAYKEAGVAAGKNTKREFVFDIPLTIKEDKVEEPKNSSTQKGRVLHDDEDLTSKGALPLPGSWLGQVFQINYVFKVYVKHDAWNSIGEGNCVELPLRIINQPRLIQSQEHYRVPANWSPVSGILEPVYLYHEAERVSLYYKNVFCENWKDWYAKVELPNPFIFGGEIKAVAKPIEPKKIVQIQQPKIS